MGVSISRRTDLGDIIVRMATSTAMGDVAARLEAITDPCGICISGTVRDHIGDRLDVIFDDMGDQNLKKIARPVRATRTVSLDRDTRHAPVPTKAPPVVTLPNKPSIASCRSRTERRSCRNT